VVSGLFEIHETVFNMGWSMVYLEIVKQSLKHEGSMVYLEIRKYCLNRGGLCHFGSLGFLEIIKHSLNRSSLFYMKIIQCIFLITGVVCGLLGKHKAHA